MKGLSVIIPVLDEEKSIGSVIDDIQKTLKRSDREFEIIVVDDGSKDKTSGIVKGKNVILMSHPTPGGYGLSLRDGIMRAQHNEVVIIDGDGTYPVERIPELVDCLNDYDMVIGARTGQFYRESLLKNPFRKVLQILCEFVVGNKIPDVNSGFRAFKKDVVMQFKESFCLGFSFTTTITLALHLNGYFIKYIPIEFYKRIGRRPHVQFLRDSLRTLQIVTQAILYHNPIKLFLLLSMMVLLGGVVSTFVYFMKNSLFPLLIGMMLFLACFMFMGMGLVCEVIRKERYSGPGKLDQKPA